MSQREQQKTHTRNEILGSAIHRLKTGGLAGASVSDIMARAGRTVGGFYAHFASKEALAAEAVRSAVAARRAQFVARFEGVAGAARVNSALREYFTAEHRDDPVNGCPLAMATIEAARTEAVAAGFGAELDRFATAFECGDTDTTDVPREVALGTLALMVGGMLLARATSGTPLSDEILDAAASYGSAAVSELVGVSR